jgi:lipid II:glycine glycyltransferase (peptidoglycan interpeptide bridge formation enzyme)
MPSIGLHYNNPAESIVGKHSFDKELLEVVAVYFKGLNLDLLDIALPTNIADTQPFSWLGFKAQFRYTYHLPLHLSEEELWTRLSSEKRKSISKAEKDGLEIKLCTDYSAALAMVLEGLRRNKALANQTLIEAIISEKNAEQLVMFGAYENQNLLAVTVCINEYNSLIYLFGGTANTGRHHGAGVSCMYKSILHAKHLGKDIFDFEGSMQPGIERYFREFGGDLVNFASISKHAFLIDLFMRMKR